MHDFSTSTNDAVTRGHYYRGECVISINPGIIINCSALSLFLSLTRAGQQPRIVGSLACPRIKPFSPTSRHKPVIERAGDPKRIPALISNVGELVNLSGDRPAGLYRAITRTLINGRLIYRLLTLDCDYRLMRNYGFPLSRCRVSRSARFATYRY